MITLNGQESSSSLLLINGVPNVLTVEQAMYSSTPAYGRITVGAVTPATGKYISVNGLTITSVTENPEGRKFLLNADSQSTAYSIINALKSIPQINGNYELYLDKDNIGSLYIRARQPGHDHDLSITTDIQGISMTTYAADNQGWNLDTILVDVFQDGSFNATLEKDVAGASTSFDISPALTPDYGKVSSCSAVLRGVNPQDMVATLDTFNFKCLKGYRTNNSDMYLQPVNQMAQYLGRGTLKSGTDNRTTLYISANKPLVFSYINISSTSLQFEMSYLTSSLETVATDTHTVSSASTGIVDIEYDMSDYMGNDIYYIDVQMPDGYVCRWNVIRPDRASESVNRLLWRNEFGGLSFADMTSATVEELDMDRKNIEKTLYRTYEEDIEGNILTWSSRYETRLTLTSHLIDKDGTYLFNSLAGASLVWLEREGVTRYVRVTEVKPSESDVNDVFTVQVKVEYRQ